MKKICAVFCVILLMLTLTACGNKKAYPYTTENQVITQGLFNYYSDKVRSDPAFYGAEAENAESIKNAVKKCCSEYLAAIILMEQEDISLDSEFKRLAAENTENIWSLFSDYYEKVGVTKQDITKVQTHESRLLQLLDHFYGAEGKEPVSEDDMKEKFVDMYVGFKAIEGSLYKTNDKNENIPLSEKETKELENLFSDMASRINDGTATIDELNEEYNNSQGIIVTSSLSVLLAKEGDPMYDDDFFSKVCEITHGKAKMIKSGSSIFVIERQTIATDDEDAFMLYRSEVLQSMRMGKIKKKLNNIIKGIVLEENEKVIKKLLG